MTTRALRQLCDPYGLDPKLSGLECDGVSRVLSYVLAQHGIDHRLISGAVSWDGLWMPHFWIEASAWMIDYRLRMWFGPHGKLEPRSKLQPPQGIFRADRYRQLSYFHPQQLPSMECRELFDILTTTFP